jgi:hypothetical protein
MDRKSKSPLPSSASYAPKLFRALEIAQVDGSLPSLLKRLTRAALLIVDDLGISSVSGKLYRQFLEILDDRQGHGATMITSHPFIREPQRRFAPITVRYRRNAVRHGSEQVYELIGIRKVSSARV